MKRRLFWLVLLALSPVTCIAGSMDAGALFKTKCAMCHGADGTGQTPMGEKLGIKSYKSPDIQKQSDADIKNAIINGKGKMPAFGQRLTPDQVDALVKYIREVGK